MLAASSLKTISLIYLPLLPQIAYIFVRKTEKARMNTVFRSPQKSTSYHHRQNQQAQKSCNEDLCADQSRLENDFMQRRTEWIQRGLYEPQELRHAFLEARQV